MKAVERERVIVVDEEDENGAVGSDDNTEAGGGGVAGSWRTVIDVHALKANK